MQMFGITGPAKAGKSVLAKYLHASFALKGVQVNILPFAAPLKSFAIQLGWDGKKDESGRRLLQLLGTEVARECISEDIWLKHWVNSANIFAKRNPYATFIIDDVRFNNEANFIREAGGQVCEIVGRTEYKRDHDSELGLNPALVDFKVNNSYDLAKLKDAARFIARDLKW